MSFMNLSLLLKKCPRRVVHLTWMVCEMGSQWLCSSCFVVYCFYYLFKIAQSISLRIRWHPTETNTDDLVLLTNTPTQAKSKLHSLEQAARGTGHHVIADITEFMRFKQDEAIYTWNGKPLKLVDPFTYFDSNSLKIFLNIHQWVEIRSFIASRRILLWKKNVITQQEFELTSYVVAIQYISYDTMGNPDLVL